MCHKACKGAGPGRRGGGSPPRVGNAASPFRPPTPDSHSPLHHVRLASRERIGAAVLSYVGETGFCGISAAHGSVYSRHGTEYSA